VPFRTPLIDLSRSEEQLWQKLEPKSCRYEIRKAQKTDCVISLNEKTDAARLLINDSIRRLQYRAQLDQNEWQALLPDHDVFLCRWQGIPVAAHVILRDRPGRARLLLSGGADRGDERLRAVIGPCNRLLHWHELRHYKAEGFHIYDFGGGDLDKKSPHYWNTQFKLSFGGEVVAEPILYLAKNPALRALLRLRSTARNALRKVPWPDAWLKAVRTRPKLTSLFR
jgi:lipid II:glycine glycyltransferase (peptidoglycan interpeptide bridge formation enzyme)